MFGFIPKRHPQLWEKSLEPSVIYHTWCTESYMETTAAKIVEPDNKEYQEQSVMNATKSANSQFGGQPQQQHSNSTTDNILGNMLNNVYNNNPSLENNMLQQQPNNVFPAIANNFTTMHHQNQGYFLCNKSSRPLYQYKRPWKTLSFLIICKAC